MDLFRTICDVLGFFYASTVNCLLVMTIVSVLTSTVVWVKNKK